MAQLARLTYTALVSVDFGIHYFRRQAVIQSVGIAAHQLMIV